MTKMTNRTEVQQSGKFTRRLFLQSSLVAAGSALLIPRLGFAQTGVSPNDRMGAMVVGAGGRGRDHLMSLVSDPRTIVLYICDPDQMRAESAARSVAEKQNFMPKIIRDMREALDDPALDIVTCASVNHWHTLCGIWALQHGKHVFLEKPISSTILEGKSIEAAAKKYDRICQVGTQRRTHTGFMDAVSFVRSGGIGDVKLVRGICYKRRTSIGKLGQYDIPKEVDYDLWCGPIQKSPLTRPKFHYDWHWQRHCGNGEIGNNGPHFCDLGRWFLGVERFPDRVFAYGARVGYDLDAKETNFVEAGDTPNTHVSVFEFGDRTIVMECRGLETAPLNGVTFGVVVYGSEGHITCNQESAGAAYDKKGKQIRSFTGKAYNFQSFLDAVEKNDKKMIKADARCGALSAALCHLGNIAYYVGEADKIPFEKIGAKIGQIGTDSVHGDIFRETKAHLEKNGIDLGKSQFVFGSPLTMDSEKEVFVDNAMANDLMARKDREGFSVPAPEFV